MIILFEGVDKAGKSTILKDVQSVLSCSTFKNTAIKPTDEDFDPVKLAGFYIGAYELAQNLREEGHILFDRSHITEIVYSNRRGYSALDLFNWLEYEEKLSNFLVVYMSAPVDVIKKRFVTENETYLSAEEIEGTLDLYDSYLSVSKLRVIRLSSLDSRLDNLEKVIQALRTN